MTSVSRRNLLKISSAATAAIGLTPSASAQDSGKTAGFQSVWHKTHDRVFLGGDYWANPMEDWRIVDGYAECQTTGGFRNIQLLTHQLTGRDGKFEISVDSQLVEVKQVNGGCGFQIGVKSDINEHRSNCFAKSGIRAGIFQDKLTLGKKQVELPDINLKKGFRLHLSGLGENASFALVLSVSDKNGETIAKVQNRFPAQSIAGNICLVNNFNPGLKKGQGARYRFQHWKAQGDAFTYQPENRFGPLLWTMYSLSDSRSKEGFVLKLTALTGPLGKDDNTDVTLTTNHGKQVQKVSLDPESWTATFRIPNWNEMSPADYQVEYVENFKDGTSSKSSWKGTIRQNPSGRPLRLAALTCQNDYAFPYEPVANNIVKLDPDLLYFSGDQLYENHGGYGLIRDPAGPAILNYLRKFYQFGWSFRNAMKDCPTICIPDDHDVFQGNIWGEGGAKMDQNGGTSSKGGYREPARMVNVVHRTCVSHHPDYYDPKPCKQDISVYFGDLVYGDVSFAILGDRQWKSGPERVAFWGGRADHVKDNSIDVARLDKPGLELLGKRQEDFLRAWAKDWRGHSMKVLLSQTVFGAVATHHGNYKGYLKADLDSGGWPQTPRDRAIDIIRDAKPLHINGDQHLTSLVQYGVKKQRDSCWSFCTPAIAAGYPRWWRPDESGMDHSARPSHGLANTGEYVDGFGNNVYVYAVGNPEVASKKNRYERAHQKGSGFGFVTIDPKNRTYLIESYRFLIDPKDGKADNQFPGWPVTLHQDENGGNNRLS